MSSSGFRIQFADTVDNTMTQTTVMYITSVDKFPLVFPGYGAILHDIDSKLISVRPVPKLVPGDCFGYYCYESWWYLYDEHYVLSLENFDVNKHFLDECRQNKMSIQRLVETTRGIQVYPDRHRFYSQDPESLPITEPEKETPPDIDIGELLGRFYTSSFVRKTSAYFKALEGRWGGSIQDWEHLRATFDSFQQFSDYFCLDQYPPLIIRGENPYYPGFHHRKFTWNTRTFSSPTSDTILKAWVAQYGCGDYRNKGNFTNVPHLKKCDWVHVHKKYLYSEPTRIDIEYDFTVVDVRSICFTDCHKITLDALSSSGSKILSMIILFEMAQHMEDGFLPQIHHEKHVFLDRQVAYFDRFISIKFLAQILAFINDDKIVGREVCDEILFQAALWPTPELITKLKDIGNKYAAEIFERNDVSYQSFAYLGIYWHPFVVAKLYKELNMPHNFDNFIPGWHSLSMECEIFTRYTHTFKVSRITSHSAYDKIYESKPCWGWFCRGCPQPVN